MAIRNFFKFREVPESETAKPFLEHLEDLRWTVVKMAITLFAAMILCFAFRTSLVQIMQRPMHAVDPKLGALRA
nr:twin-arginine translocase subunit TatC [Verrucomicrobiota bacterium]